MMMSYDASGDVEGGDDDVEDDDDDVYFLGLVGRIE